jgi:hypothetical protein
MAFGFPASYQVIFSDIPAGTDLGRSIGSALSRIGWNPTVEKNTFKASTTLNMGSMGEKIIVEVLPNKSIKVRSHSSFFLLCLDMGKNKKNVEKFLQELPRHYVASGSLGSVR